MRRFSLAVFAGAGLLSAAFGTALFGAARIAPLAPAPFAPLAPTPAQFAPFAPTPIQLAPTTAPSRTLIDSYCITCHNQRTKTADLALDTLSLADVSAHADVWEEVVRKLRGGLMPPAGVRRPPQAEVDAFVGSLEGALDRAALANPNPGRVALHRMNRAEYANAIEDLLGVRVDAAALLPKDDEADGFDNVASVLTVSPSFLEQYISAARVVTNMALGNRAQKAVSQTYRPPRGTDQTQRVEGLPLGTRGGFLIEHLFPADGQYKVNIGGLAGAGYVRGMEYAHTLVVTLDGAKVFQGRIGGEEDLRAIDQQQAAAVAAINGRFQNIPLTVTAGPHKIGVTFVARTLAESDDVLGSFKPGAIEDRIVRVGSVEILGPFDPAGLSETPARQRVFVCRPASAKGSGGARPDSTESRRSSREIEASEVGCASKIFSNLAYRAFRRPVTTQDLEAPLTFYRSARQNGSDFESAIRESLPAILASPKFLFRSEVTPRTVKAGVAHRITDLELASRLSFFLTGRAPDQPLLEAAEKGLLGRRATLESHIKRLLGDVRSKSLVTNFAFQWLKMRALDDADPDAILFPNFDDSLREAFKREVELFVHSVFTRGSQRPRTADGELHLRERAAGAPLRHPERARHTLPPRDAGRPASLRPAGQGRRADGDVVCESHGARPARSLDSREPDGHAASRAAARRRGVPREQGRRESQIGAGDHGDAPRQAVVQLLPRHHGPAWLCARELRRDWRVAQCRSMGGDADRRVGQAG